MAVGGVRGRVHGGPRGHDRVAHPGRGLDGHRGALSLTTTTNGRRGASAPAAAVGAHAWCASLLRLLRYDLDLKASLDVVVQAHLDDVAAQRLDGLVDLDAAAVELVAAGLLDGLGDVGGGDGAEEAPACAGPHRDGDGVGLKGVADGRGLLGRGDLPLAPRRTDLVDLALGALRPRRGQPPGQQVVAGVAVLDVDDVTGRAQPGYLVGKNHLCHVCRLPQRAELAYGSNAISRAFFTAFAMARCSWTETPVTRRARILPRSEPNLSRSRVDLETKPRHPLA